MLAATTDRSPEKPKSMSSGNKRKKVIKISGTLCQGRAVDMLGILPTHRPVTRPWQRTISSVAVMKNQWLCKCRCRGLEYLYYFSWDTPYIDLYNSCWDICFTVYDRLASFHARMLHSKISRPETCTGVTEWADCDCIRNQRDQWLVWILLKGALKYIVFLTAVNTKCRNTKRPHLNLSPNPCWVHY